MRCGRTAVSSLLVVGFVGSASAVMTAGQSSGQSQPSQSPASTRSERSSHLSVNGFSVVLVIADLQAAPGGDDVPSAARQALTDMKDFLPYKSYKLLDAAWILGTGRTTSRLRGPEDRDYEVEIASYPASSPKATAGAAAAGPAADERHIYVQFSLRESLAPDDLAQAALSLEKGSKGSGDKPSAAEDAREASLRSQLTQAEAKLRMLRERMNDSNPEVKKSEQEVRELKAQLNEMKASGHDKSDKFERGRARSIMNTSFSMDIGETVVVGTSRLKGNSKALIALLTAVPPRSTRTSR
jgi:hypothetical protein